MVYSTWSRCRYSKIWGIIDPGKRLVFQYRWMFAIYFAELYGIYWMLIFLFLEDITLAKNKNDTLTFWICHSLYYLLCWFHAETYSIASNYINHIPCNVSHVIWYVIFLILHVIYLFNVTLSTHVYYTF